MVKKLILLAALAAIFLASASSVNALALAKTIYVKESYTGLEVGTYSQPYNTLQEAIAIAQATPGGANIKLYDTAIGNYVYWGFIAAVKVGAGGIPLTDSLLYAILSVLALALLLVGWQFQKRSRQLQN